VADLQARAARAAGKRGVHREHLLEAARNAYPLVGYKTTKAAVVALTENLAAANARYGVRAHAILPGLMNTPMAIEARVAQGTAREEVIASRDRRVPLRRRMGTGWDVA
jgi:NAD(P)-dependent dehydrogenase (short-subunit alcohol dehydrogenase family)